MQKAVLEAIGAGVVKSAHDCADGGLAVALVECCFRYGADDPIGCDVNVEGGIRVDALLFGETQSRVILTANAAGIEKIKSIAAAHGVPVSILGKVGGESINIKVNGQEKINRQVAKLKKLWQEAIPKLLNS